jgi:hypothetical protein
VKKNEVPQDQGPESALNRLMFAQDEDGTFVTVRSVGWDPSNHCFEQYWDEMNAQTRAARALVEQGRVSPLHYYMRANVMTAALLASYTGIWRLRVWLHLKPWFFNRLKPATLLRYAEVFGVNPEQIKTLPPPRDVKGGPAA